MRPLTRWAARSLLGLLAAVVLLAVPVQPGSATSGAVRTTTPVRHLVVMTQDEHSFDSYLGSRAGVDGLRSAVCQPRRAASPTPCARPFPVVRAGLRFRLSATATAQARSVDGGRMDGFAIAQAAGRSDGRNAMGYYRPSDLPVLSELADHGVVFDRWFSAVPGGSIANRLFAISGAAVPDTELVPAGGWPDLPLVFDRLQAAGVSWTVYVEHYEPALTVSVAGAKARRGGQVARLPLLAMARYEKSPALMAHVADLDQYFADLAAGTLPAVSWIVTTASTERPPSDPSLGQREVRNVVNALGGSSAWSSSALLLTYDSPGGWYDHVVPPVRDGQRLGLRVPTLLVSPYATPGRVDHTSMDSASVLRFIETNWRVPALTARDAGATDLAAAFRFGRRPGPATVVGTTSDRPPLVQPHRPVIVLGYLLALLGAAGAIAFGALGARSPSGEVTAEAAR